MDKSEEYYRTVRSQLNEDLTKSRNETSNNHVSKQRPAASPRKERPKTLDSGKSDKQDVGSKVIKVSGMTFKRKETSRVKAGPTAVSPLKATIGVPKNSTPYSGKLIRVTREDKKSSNIPIKTNFEFLWNEHLKNTKQSVQGEKDDSDVSKPKSGPIKTTQRSCREIKVKIIVPATSNIAVTSNHIDNRHEDGTRPPLFNIQQVSQVIKSVLQNLSAGGGGGPPSDHSDSSGDTRSSDSGRRRGSRRPNSGGDDDPNRARRPNRTNDSNGNQAVRQGTAPPRQFVGGKEPMIKDFDGEDISSAALWLMSYQNATNTMRWTSADKAANFQQYLTGSAAEWFKNHFGLNRKRSVEDLLNPTVLVWEDIVHAFYDRFLGRGAAAQFIDMYNSFAARPSENWLSMCQRYRTIAEMAYSQLSDEDKIQNLATKFGTKDANIAMQMMSCQTFEQLEKFCKTLDLVKASQPFDHMASQFQRPNQPGPN